MIRRIAAALLLTALAWAPQQPGELLDEGTIAVHLLGREVGAEDYSLRRLDDRLVLTDHFSFVDRGGAISLDSQLELDSEFIPLRVTAVGRTYRFLQVDLDVEVADGVATISNLGETARVDVTDRIGLRSLVRELTLDYSVAKVPATETWIPHLHPGRHRRDEDPRRGRGAAPARADRRAVGPGFRAVPNGL